MIVILMGVTGTGKTTVGRVLAGKLGWPFHDADDDHPASNVAKMHAGVPLTDDDRRPWLDALSRRIDATRARGESLVLACSALKHAYQHVLAHDFSDVKFVELTAPPDVLRSRLAARKGHFMNPTLLDSQIRTLEPPEGAIEVDVRPAPDAVADEIRRRLGV